MMRKHSSSLARICLETNAPRVYRLLDFRLLRVLTELLIDFGLPLGPVSHIAEQHKENFFRGFCWHGLSPSGEFRRLGCPKAGYARVSDGTSCQKCQRRLRTRSYMDGKRVNQVLLAAEPKRPVALATLPEDSTLPIQPPVQNLYLK